MDSLDYAAIVTELKREVEGGFLRNIYRLTKDAYLLRFYVPSKGEKDLILEVGRRLNLTMYKYKDYLVADHVVSTLRRHLRGLKLVEIKQVDFDRIVEFIFKGKGVVHRLVMEFIGRGNLILLKEGGEVIVAHEYFKGKDREVVQGRRYSYPPPRGDDPLTIEEGRLIEGLKHFKGGLEGYLVNRLNVSRRLIKEAIYRAGASGDKPVQEEAYKLHAVLRELKKMIEDVRKGALEPCLIRRGSELVPCPLSLISVKGEPLKYDSFNEAVDVCFADSLIKRMEEERAKPLEEERKRLRRILESQEGTREEYLNRASLMRSLADKLFLNLEAVERALTIAKDDPKKAQELLRSMGLNVIDVKVDMEKRNVTLEFEGSIKLVAPMKSNAARAISQIYEEAKKYVRKAERISEEMEKVRERIKEIESKRRTLTRVVKRKERERWYQNFIWAFSSEGILMVGGKDASQNEALVKKYMDPNDIFLHAEIYGGPVVLIKAGGKSIGERTLLEAAELAAAFSRAWELGFYQVDVLWVYGKQVSKKAPSGEFLKRGSFMIYGKRNYLKGVPVRLGVGLDEDGNLKIGPASVIDALQDAMILTPGRVPREKIAEVLLRAIKVKGGKEADKGSIISMLPKGRYYVLKAKGILSDVATDLIKSK